jgi:hypothetical protein
LVETDEVQLLIALHMVTMVWLWLGDCAHDSHEADGQWILPLAACVR